MFWIAVFFGYCFGLGAGEWASVYYGRDVGGAVMLMVTPCAICFWYVILRLFDFLFEPPESIAEKLRRR